MGPRKQRLGRAERQAGFLGLVLPWAPPWLALTQARGLVAAAVAGGPPEHVAGALGCPEAAVVEADDIVEPVGEARHAGRCSERRRTPIVAAVRGAAARRVGRQELRALLGIAALLARGILGAGGTDRSGPPLAILPPGSAWCPNRHLGAHLACTERTQCTAPGW